MPKTSIESITFSSPCLCGRSDYVIDVAFRSYKVVKCANCGLLRTLPPPRPNYLKPMPRDWSSMTRNIDAEQSNRRVYERIMDEAQLFKGHGKLLDIGCGWGQLLHLASEQGFDAVGVDVNGDAVMYGKRFFGAMIVHADFLQAGFRQESFDVIVMNHVIEHLEDPRPMLKMAHSLLKSDGILLVGCPNAQGFMRKIEGSRCSSIYNPKDHFWHFTAQTLSQILKSCGFKPERFRFVGGLTFSSRGMYFPPLLLYGLRKRKTARTTLYTFFMLPLLLVLDRLNMTDDMLVVSMKQAGC